MSITRVLEIMENEMECVRRADTCGRDCGKCDLVMDTNELLEAYELAVWALEEIDP